MGEAKTYPGGCHCGEVRFEVTADLGTVVTCNCSICQRSGALLMFLPRDTVTVEAAPDTMATYTFN